MKLQAWVFAGALAMAGLGSARADEVRVHQEVDSQSDRADVGAQTGDEAVKVDQRQRRESRDSAGVGGSGSMTHDTATDANQQMQSAGDQAEDKAQRALEKGSEKSEAVGSKLSDAMAEGAEAINPPDAPQKGELHDGDAVKNTVVTNPLGYFTGQGLNAEYSKPVGAEKVSVVAGARYSRTNTADGAATAFGVEGGADYFVLGRNNEGLRVGPRITAGVGTDTVGANNLGANLGAGGELGYNWIATNGITAGLAGGVIGNLAGSVDTNKDGQAEKGLDPYGRINVGYSW